MNDVPVCYFCGKDHKQVKRLIVDVGPFGLPDVPKRAICWDCVILQMQTLASERASFRDELIAILQAVEPKYSD